MSLYIDVKYVSYIAGRLRNFKKKDANLWNFSCPVCLDSANDKRKARGYIYMREQKLFAMCHNCGFSKPFGALLETVDPLLYSEYRLEVYRDKHETPVSRPKPQVEKEEPQEAFKTSTASRLKTRVVAPPPSLLDRLMDRMDTLPDDHEAVIYARGRKIPDDQFHKLYFIKNLRDIVQLNVEKYDGRIKTIEPRIVLPFFDLKGQLTGVTCRAVRGEELRYVVVKVKDDAPLIFGINDIDRSKLVYVVEGPIDSLFLPNAIAVGGTSMGKVGSLGLRNKVVIFDNQPRNKDVCRIIEKNIDAGETVVIWSERITAKDINEMSEDGIDYMKEIESRTFQGLQAKLEFNEWKKC
jgi:hypothetical protein